ncbi:hypothetical protein D9619_007478 [Psilocybe cf. subviscida]|uniref:Uncharacterized protein n=1 Tax=Psilocybe cf. subviscida TaxID=2480587 RepID=A0A8H5B1S7_9AGAR|nr:hypothetical protein D9619_007478 [Psilocybe cf. subviscida]
MLGERKTVRVIRGFLGLVFLATIVFWGFSNILFEPMKETALGPIREFRTRRPPTDFLSTIDPPVWNIIIQFLLLDAPFDIKPVGTNITDPNHPPILTPDLFDQSITVTAIWGTLDNATDKPPCTRADAPINSTDYPYLTSYRFLCRTGVRVSSYLLPDLYIRVNFTLIAEALAVTSPLHPQISLPIIIGMTNSDKKSIKHVFEKTIPTTMIPGFNLAAPIYTDIRQIFSHRAMAALGLFQDTSVFWEARFEHMYPDLYVPEAERSVNVSTLRLFKLNNWSDTRVIQDYRMNSVIAGFADVGGAKPLSIFGIAHSFHYKHMKEETLRLYPNIVNEHKELGKRGLLALLRDHLIDLNFLEKEFIDTPGPVGDQDNVPLMDIERPAVEDSKESHTAEIPDLPSRHSVRNATIDKPSGPESM